MLISRLILNENLTVKIESLWLIERCLFTKNETEKIEREGERGVSNVRGL